MTTNPENNVRKAVTDSVENILHVAGTPVDRATVEAAVGEAVDAAKLPASVVNPPASNDEGSRPA